LYLNNLPLKDIMEMFSGFGIRYRQKKYHKVSAVILSGTSISESCPSPNND
jgi:hypothetical protein